MVKFIMKYKKIYKKNTQRNVTLGQTPHSKGPVQCSVGPGPMELIYDSMMIMIYICMTIVIYDITTKKYI